MNNGKSKTDDEQRAMDDSRQEAVSTTTTERGHRTTDRLSSFQLAGVHPVRWESIDVSYGTLWIYRFKRLDFFAWTRKNHFLMEIGSDRKTTGYPSYCLDGHRLGNATFTAIRWVLGLIFLYAGGSKLVAPRSFAVLIDAYGLVPEPILMPLAIGLPALEVAAAVGLMADVRGSLTTMTALMLVFVAVLLYGIHMGLDVDCGCFGPGDPEANAFHGLREALYRDLALLAGIAYLYGWRRHRFRASEGAPEAVRES